MVDEFVTAGTTRSDFPPVVFVYQGTSEQGPMFFDRYDEHATAVADPDGALYAAFGVPRGGIGEMFGARSWFAGLRATARDHLVSRRIGDPWTMPMVLAVRDGMIVGEFVGRHAGELPDMASISTTLRPN